MFVKQSYLTAAIAAMALSLCQLNTAKAQIGTSGQQKGMITTTVPFLIVPPESRAAGMGDAGVATSPDANAIHWNPSKLAFIDKDYGASLSYSPWLRNIVPDMSLSYISGYYRLRKQDVLGASIRYFNLGTLNLTDDRGQSLGDQSPREFAFDLTYSRQLSKRFSMGVTLRYLQSLLVGQIQQGRPTAASPASSAAVDISLFHTKPNIMIGGVNTTWNWGVNISNIGPRITYVSNRDQDFIPTNLRLGTAITGNFDEYNSLTLALDANKLLVPTPTYDANGALIRDPNQSLISAIGSSLTSAPGGFSEKMAEVQLSIGLEYWYNKLLAIRTGYFYEDATKGNRKYFTLGGGIRYSVFGLDFAYMLPQGQNHPLADTFRFTLLFNFTKSGKKAAGDGDVPAESTPSN
jgi:hypothetical protein